jgi:nitroreductase
MATPDSIPLPGYVEYPADEMRRRAAAFRAEMARRRSVREFAPRPVARELIADCIATAAAAPSGANRQPWHFVVVEDPAVKHRIREAAEQEERAFYGGRAPAEWLQALAPLGTDADKPFLDVAPALIVIFAELYGLDREGRKVKHYYVQESVGIATGLLIAAVHHAGLVCLTHTPSPMAFLGRLLDRPENERAFLLLAVGYPGAGARVPAITRKPLDAVCTFVG